MHLASCFLSLPIGFGLITATLASFYYETWEYGNRTDLKCPKKWCEENHPTRFVSCCVCNAKCSWELDGSLNYLRLEYTQRDGNGIVLGINVSPAALTHYKGMLTELPKNLCQFTAIVKLYLKHNFIASLAGISCLSNLDTLDVSYNRIRYIKNDTFTGMPMLRVLNVTHNGLEYLDPFTIANTHLKLFHVDFSYNNQKILDVSNIVPENNFCKYDFKCNQIKDFVNDGNFQINIDKIYEGGYVELIGNNFDEFFDFKELGLDDILVFGKILNFGFSLADSNMTCNCIMQPYLKLAEQVIKRIWRNYFNITCAGPSDLKGQSIVDIVKEDRLDELVCVINETMKCPRYCECYEQPNRNRTVVDCSSREYEHMPNYLPEKHNITLNLRNNSISTIINANKLTNVTTIDISQNQLQSISRAAVMIMTDYKSINLTTNKISQLSRYFQTLHPCSTYFGNITVNCDCNSFWIRDWLVNKNNYLCYNITKITCLTKSGTIPALEITMDDICNDKNSLFEILTSIFGIMSSFVLAIFGTLYIYRYELYILRRRCCPKIFSKVSTEAKYDAYISFYENNDSIRQWVVKNFDYHLTLRGYRAYIPCRDMVIGSSLEEEISLGVASSRHFIIIICDSYLDEDSIHTSIEWKYIWNSFRQTPSKNIIIINFGLLDTSAVSNPKMKAFLRLGLDLDFANRTRSLLKDVSCRLGPPMRSKRKKDLNAKTIFKGTNWTPVKVFKNINTDLITIKV